jgi:hypothetical protein
VHVATAIVVLDIERPSIRTSRREATKALMSSELKDMNGGIWNAIGAI